MINPLIVTMFINYRCTFTIVARMINDVDGDGDFEEEGKGLVLIGLKEASNVLLEGKGKTK